MNWKRLSSTYLSDHIYFKARRDRCEMPDGRIVDPYFVVELPPCVCALAITEEGKVILVEQYRHPIEEAILEVPGGFIDAGEAPETAVARELEEETGYRFSNFYYLGKLAGNPGVLNNFTHFFLATGGRKGAGQQLDWNEEINIRYFSVEEVKELLRRFEIKQSLHAACLFYGLEKLATL